MKQSFSSQAQRQRQRQRKAKQKPFSKSRTQRQRKERGWQRQGVFPRDTVPFVGAICRVLKRGARNTTLNEIHTKASASYMAAAAASSEAEAVLHASLSRAHRTRTKWTAMKTMTIVSP